jgi:hypothetical protein
VLNDYMGRLPDRVDVLGDGFVSRLQSKEATTEGGSETDLGCREAWRRGGGESGRVVPARTAEEYGLAYAGDARSIRLSDVVPEDGARLQGMSPEDAGGVHGDERYREALGRPGEHRGRKAARVACGHRIRSTTGIPAMDLIPMVTADTARRRATGPRRRRRRRTSIFAGRRQP